ncbi:MAG: CDP-diacylglycerol--serine O-phosphatidyltransferase [Bacteroidales bacterium]|nr:CDP-diacylglycerol--serine O-phosphatidyltransferase [Bacteroidales bacterium]
MTIKKHIPNLITSLNLAAGFIAIVFAAENDLITSSWLILAAMAFDFLDGFSARLLKAYSPMGKELDSLADVVSFGIAPAMIVYILIESSGSVTDSFSASGNISGNPEILKYLSVLMPVFAALRLAKFNIDASQAKSFKGLPTPANALAVISVVIAAHHSGAGILESIISSPIILSVYTIILSLMMVSRIPLISLKMSNLRLRGNEGQYILFILIIISLFIWRLAATPLIIPFYIIASLISSHFPKTGK